MGMWVGSMPALTGLIRNQNLGFSALFDKIRYGLSSLSSLLSLHGPRTKADDPLQNKGSSQALHQNLLGQPRERYIELQDKSDG